MPSSYVIDRERRLVISRAWGALTTGEVADHYRALGSDPKFDPTFSQLADLTAVEHIEMDAASVRREALEVVFSTRSPRAFVVANAEQEDAARLYGLFGKYVRQNVRVFRGIAEAEHWLGLVPAGSRSEPREGLRPESR